MKNEDKNLNKLLSFMKDDLQKNGYTIEQKSFDFSKEETISFFSNHEDECLPCGEDLINIIKKDKIFKDDTILNEIILSAKSQELIAVRHGGRHYHTKGDKQSTDLINISLTEKGMLWLKNYQSGLDKLKQYLIKNIFKIITIVIAAFALYLKYG